MKRKILYAQDMDVSGKRMVEEAGFEIVMAPDENVETMKRLIKDCEAVVSKTFFLSEDILKAGEKLQVVAKHGVGIDNVVDLDTATRLGLYVVNTPEANSDSVAEKTIAGILAFSEKIVGQHLATKEFDFEAQNCGDMHEIKGKTLGLIGLGNIGRRVAKIAANGFDMKVLGYDPFIKKELLPDYVELVDDIERIYKESDFVSLHLGATPETVGMIGKKQLALMKKTAVLVNNARGALVIEGDLADAIKNGDIAGAVLDVFSEEPARPSDPLIPLDHVLLSPHCAALTDEAMEKMSAGAARGMIEVLTGKKPTWCLNYELVQKVREGKGALHENTQMVG